MTQIMLVIDYRRGHKIFFCKYLTAGRLKTNLNGLHIPLRLYFSSWLSIISLLSDKKNTQQEALSVDISDTQEAWNIPGLTTPEAQ